jgi:hypothetical protein
MVWRDHFRPLLSLRRQLTLPYWQVLRTDAVLSLTRNVLALTTRERLCAYWFDQLSSFIP